jgi:hypothetical protein
MPAIRPSWKVGFTRETLRRTRWCVAHPGQHLLWNSDALVEALDGVAAPTCCDELGDLPSNVRLVELVVERKRRLE